jgi:hypothetical protein
MVHERGGTLRYFQNFQDVQCVRCKTIDGRQCERRMVEPLACRDVVTVVQLVGPK